MTSKDTAAPGLKQKAMREFKDYIVISLYLAFFFCALVAYTMLLLKKYDVQSESLNFAFAIIRALVIAKVILIGEMVRIGRHAEARPLYQSVLYKSVVFSLFVLAFHFVEEYVKSLIHHESFGTVLHNTNADQLIGRSILVFSTFIPLFAFIELRRALGEEKFYSLFLKPGAADNTSV